MDFNYTMDILSRIEIGAELLTNRTFDVVKQYSDCKYDFEHQKIPYAIKIAPGVKKRQTIFTIILSHSGKTNILLTGEKRNCSFNCFFKYTNSENYILECYDLQKINVNYCGNDEFEIELISRDGWKHYSYKMLIQGGRKFRIGCELLTDKQEYIVIKHDSNIEVNQIV